MHVRRLWYILTVCGGASLEFIVSDRGSYACWPSSMTTPWRDLVVFNVVALAYASTLIVRRGGSSPPVQAIGELVERDLTSPRAREWVGSERQPVRLIGDGRTVMVQ